ncbi:hypothetical protein ASF82_00945 [Frigoribacterium sp. Leaf164]|uniref:hypothetical protein n=1 Tax=Frigoribacterium sp. Leaf164 TaxID=1736282 RepID=UPI0006FAFF7B|nr:hypothetical protein [Frigoribacterium sp. Leaf164]KQR46142.1 hypothetical protein ASF82_00945 [Frigoribacterium sp. Leaf164]
MKHITFADKDFLVGDAIADAVLEYAAMLGETGSADSIDLTAYGADGDVVSATLFLSAGVALVAESTNSPLPEPDNAETVAYIEGRLAQRIAPHDVQPSALPAQGADFDIDDWVSTQE